MVGKEAGKTRGGGELTIRDRMREKKKKKKEKITFVPINVFGSMKKEGG